ncbi:glucans biosynthesis glucosyltransferase MdoH [Kosakonia radicincitans]|uniref:glucans biosynthesis glucosyltransferase MdoH n=1 Tax=Kosakonia radicincitans TaxID=283686 RepID=UPI0008B4F9D5|nr:glucans biosynthesis glucosyltransferase MdoH [Kosakonia radicincitans]QEM92127.1 glucans biosynthesis glucosyltransferase MdoH [Kosakonia radicincitans]SET00529.1 membrane glycosyltransferase [Kosakonia radicincitans]
MNKTTEYIDALPLTDAEKAVLPTESILSVHQALDAEHTDWKREDDTPLGSVTARLQHSWPDSLGKEQLIKDEEGRAQLQAMPKAKRSSMFPDPWRTNPIGRFWDRLRGREVAPRYLSRLTKEEQAHEQKWRTVGSIRRYILLLLTLAQTVVATWYMKTILPYQGWALINPTDMAGQDLWVSFMQLLPYVLQTGILILFAVLFCWVSAGFWTALMGFLQLLIGRDKYSISHSTVGDEALNPEHRTALIMPICNEDVDRVFAGLRATWESVKATGQQQHFDVYILSDSYNPDICVAEQKAWMELIAEVQGEGQIFYRRRRRRVKRKSGNIDDFCRRWGSQYSYMVVLDADSVMSGECLTGLVRLMEANPNAGIIQSSPKASGMDTLYARCQQFATRVYGPLFTAGLHFWQLGESHYWGHNAIIRVKPFIEHCALAPLPGEGSFAGSILSHDFVEAALMRRAGWGVWIAYDLPGSYEELPPNLLDELKRDRRWCHGNLMNFRLFLVKGMHPVHRAVFLTGVMSYLSAPLWFMFLALSTALQVVHALTEPQYFLQPRQLFPVWPQWRPELAIALFASTMVLLFLPKLLSIILVWCKGPKEYGGFFRVTISLLLEVLFSVLLAPVRMLFHTVFVVSAFLGWEVVWNSPQRDDDSTPWGEAFMRHGSQLLLGLVWAVGMAWLDLRFLFWLAPIVFSLILSPFVSVISSRSTVGLRTKRWKLFLIPEEYSPPQVLVDTDNYLELNRSRSLEDGFMHAVFNPSFNALATAMATARHRSSRVLEIARDRHVEQALNETPEKLNRDRRLVLLSDPVTLSRLHYRVWSAPERYLSWVNHYEELKLNPLALKAK